MEYRDNSKVVKRLVIELDFTPEGVHKYTEALEVIAAQVARFQGDIPCSGECGKLRYGIQTVGEWAVIDAERRPR